MEQIEFWQTYLFGDVKFLDLLLIVMVIDIVTGVMKAAKNGNLFTKTAFVGYAKKIGIFCLIILANIIDQILGLRGALAYGTVLFYIAAEGLSIMENLAEFGMNMPVVLKDKLKVVHENSTKEDKNSKETKENKGA